MATETPWEDRVAKWFDDRNLTKGSTAEKQLPKLKEEFDELRAGVKANDLHEIKDGIGDMLVVLRGMSHMRGLEWPGMVTVSDDDNVSIEVLGLAIDHMGERPEVMGFDFILQTYIRTCIMFLKQISREHGLTIEECQEQAWNDIKDRTGRMVDGVFVKDA